LKIETEDLVKRLVEELNDIRSSIKVNEQKIRQEKEEFILNKDQLIKALEFEKENIKLRVKNSTENELHSVQSRGDSVKHNLILQLESLKEINKRLAEQKKQMEIEFYSVKKEKVSKISHIENEMLKNYEITGNDNLAKIETAYINIIKEHEQSIIELDMKRGFLLETITKMDLKKKDDVEEFCGKLNS